ncbi:hypothetical protein GN958_ATG01544, partial [Phytophthora infestans]
SGGEDTAYQDLLEYEFSSRDGNEEDDEDTDSEEQLEERKTAQSWLTSACGYRLVESWLTQLGSVRLLAHLQLGVRSLVKYFYLMYPIGALQETIRLTNINLAMNSFRTIGSTKTAIVNIWSSTSYKKFIDLVAEVVGRAQLA